MYMVAFWFILLLLLLMQIDICCWFILLWIVNKSTDKIIVYTQKLINISMLTDANENLTKIYEYIFKNK